MKYTSAVMAALYIIIGSSILWRGEEFMDVPRVYAIIIGGMLIVYGLLRGYKAYQKW